MKRYFAQADGKNEFSASKRQQPNAKKIEERNKKKQKENDNKAADHGTLGRHMTMGLELSRWDFFFVRSLL